MGSLCTPKTARPYPPGIHVPSLTWFEDSVEQDIDWVLQRQHLEFLITSGLHGIVLAGTNGEAVTLTLEEKAQLIRLTREVAAQAGRPDIPITVGCGGQSTREVIMQTRHAANAGADFVLVLTPSYFHFAMTQDAVLEFFQELADASPVPVVMYNFPRVVAGLDLNSDMLDILGCHPNIVGVKLTCGGIAKVTRIRAAFKPEEFAALAGQSDWLTPALAVGSIGTITGVANLFPKFCVHLYNLYVSGNLAEAEKAQLKLAKMEWGFGKGDINGTKWVVAKILGYPLSNCHCRRPFPKFSDDKKQSWILETCSALIEDEKKL